MVSPHSPASECHALAARSRFGTLATVSRDLPGYPFVTLVAIAFEAGGSPLLCLSSLAEHTKNLEANGYASVLVAEPHTVDDPLAAGRMTIVGNCSRMPDGAAARARFLEVHPEARQYATLADFAMWRLEVVGVRWIGGFGRMDWVDRNTYLRVP